jgi:hypothetical protein
MSSLVLIRNCAALLLVSVANQMVYVVGAEARRYISFCQTNAPPSQPRLDLPQSTASGNDRLPATACSATTASATTRLLHGRWSLIAAAPRAGSVKGFSQHFPATSVQPGAQLWMLTSSFLNAV